MKKTIFFVAVVLLYSCSKQAPSTTFTVPAPSSPTLQNVPVSPSPVPLEIKSSDWDIDPNGGIKKDLYLLYYATYPWDYGLDTVRTVILDPASGGNSKSLVQGSSLDYLGGSFSLKGNDLQFSGPVSLLPQTLKLAIDF